MSSYSWRVIATYERHLAAPSEEVIDWDAAAETGTAEQIWSRQ